MSLNSNRSLTTKIVLVSTAAIAILPAAVANAATYYVNPDGSDKLSTDSSSPGSLGYAAANAPTGSTVILDDGDYVTSSGFTVPVSDVTFQAKNWHGAVITNPTGASLWNARDKSVNVTCRGMVFGPAKQPANDDEFNHSWAGGGQAGWKLLDCEVTRNGGMGVGSNGRIEHCLFTDQYFNAFDINGCSGFTMRNSMIRRANRGNYWPDNTVGNKCDFATKMTFDGIVSYDNVGCGLWFDTNCTDFVLKNSTFFGNHAGYTWHDSMSKGGVDNESDSAFGFSTEANPDGVNYITDNVFYCNEYGSIFYHDSGGGNGAAIHIENNRFYYNPIILNAQGGGDGNAGRKYGNGIITHNYFAFNNDHPMAWWTKNGGFEYPPSKQGMVIDYNTYCPDPGTSSDWVYYHRSEISQGGQIHAKSLTDLQANPLSVEQHGKTGEMPPLRGPLVTTDFWPPKTSTLQQCQFPNNAYGTSESIHQVNDDETPYIQNAISGRKAGKAVSFTVFGHTAFEGNGPYRCDVYDFSGRYVTVTMKTTADRDALEAAVPGYAVLKPSKIHVKLTSDVSSNPYDVTAVFRK